MYLALIALFGLGEAGNESLNTRSEKFLGCCEWIDMFRRTGYNIEWNLNAEKNLPRYISVWDIGDVCLVAVYTRRETQAVLTMVGPKVLSADDGWWAKNRRIHMLWRPRCTRAF